MIDTEEFPQLQEYDYSHEDDADYDATKRSDQESRWYDTISQSLLGLGGGLQWGAFGGLGRDS